MNQILRDNIPANFKDKNFQNSLDDSSKRWLMNLNRQLAANNFPQNITNPSKNSNSSSINLAPENNTNNLSLNTQNYVPNNQNFNQMNNIQNNNQMTGYENYYYNPNNLNYIPNEQNMYFVNSSNPYYIPMNKMYSNGNYNNINPNQNLNTYIDKK